MRTTHDIQTFQSFILTLSLCLLHFERDDLSIDTALEEALSVVNIAHSLNEFHPNDRQLGFIVSNLKKVSHNYIVHPLTDLLDNPVNDSLFQLRYNLRIAIDYLTKNYSEYNDLF